MALLETITSPAALKALPADQLPALAEEIRTFLVTEVSKTGGHLGPNLGVVELTIALHRVFDSPHDTIVFDTGHQSYVHKLLTGRQDFSKLKKKGGLSGYPSRAESEHDVVENSHASTALSWADGIAKGRRLSGESDRHTVAVIGDGALTGGMAWEAINNIAVDKTLPLVIVVNDNERSYAPTIGGLADHLATLRTTRGYERFLDWGKRSLAQDAGRRRCDVRDAPRRQEGDQGHRRAAGDVRGPRAEVPRARRRPRRAGGRAGAAQGQGLRWSGHRPRHHAEGPRLPAGHRRRGRPVPRRRQVQPRDRAAVRGRRPHLDRRVQRGDGGDRRATRPDVVAITAAMLIPVGLDGFAAAYPDRVFDVGIAEQHAVTMASGLAYAGLHPVVAVYATFLNRAFDQLLMDCALHRAGVTFILDRAGVTGSDGASHNGMWDMTLTSIVPGLRLAAPRDGEQVRKQLREALDVSDGPTVHPLPEGRRRRPVDAVRSVGDVDVLFENAGDEVDLLVVGVGAFAGLATEAGEKIAAHGRTVRVVDPRWVMPVSDDVVALARRAGAVAVVEDNLVSGGVGAAVTLALREADVDVPVHTYGIPKRFLEHASRGQILEELGLTADQLVLDLETRL